MAVAAGPLWRCSVCGRFSQAQVRPHSHRRRGERCGPFEEWDTAKDVRAHGGLPGLSTFRQSLLSSLEMCPRRTRFSLELPDDLTVGYVGATGDLGTLTHEVFAEILRTMYRTGETQMATQEAVEVMYEVLAASPRVLPADERESLLIFTLRFVERPWDARRIMGLERPLSTAIRCQDGVERTLTGRPDLLLADPPDGIVVVDYKSGKGEPKKPKQPPPEGETVTGKQYLSDRGHFQLDSYGLLAMRAFPAVQHATLREWHLRSGAIREAHLAREELEHVEREIGDLMMKLERGIAEGPESPVWRPRPGAHCLRKCPVAASCPIPVEQRGDGAIADEHDADYQADRFARIDAERQQLRDRLKAYFEQTGHAPAISDGKVMRWRAKPSGKGRDFGMFDPETAEERLSLAEREQAAVDAMERELARRQAMAGVS